MKKILCFCMLLNGLVVKNEAAVGYRTNKNGIVYMVPIYPTKTNSTSVSTNVPTATATFECTNAPGYAVFVERTNLLAGQTLRAAWLSPNVFTAQNDRLELYRIEGTNAVLRASAAITLNRFETFTIREPGTYRIAYVEVSVFPLPATQTIRARSPFIVVTAPPRLTLHDGGASVVLSWFAATNRTYAVEFAPLLPTASWTKELDVRGLGICTNFVFPKSGRSLGFYRLTVR